MAQSRAARSESLFALALAAGYAGRADEGVVAPSGGDEGGDEG